MMPAPLRTRGLVVGHGGRALVGPLDLDVGPGEILAILGPNGVGKTTLLRGLVGLARPMSGDVEIGGGPAHRLSAPDLARRVAYVPQMTELPFAYSVRAVVLMGRTPHLGAFRQPGRQDHLAAEAALDRLGLHELADRTFTTLSGGERQLVVLARAMAQESPLVVLDEPTASLDLANQVRVLEVIGDLAGAGRSVVFTTHDPNQALGVAGRTLLVGRGGLRLGATGAVVDGAALSALYGVAVRIHPDADGKPAVISVRPARRRG